MEEITDRNLSVIIGPNCCNGAICKYCNGRNVDNGNYRYDIFPHISLSPFEPLQYLQIANNTATAPTAITEHEGIPLRYFSLSTLAPSDPLQYLQTAPLEPLRYIFYDRAVWAVAVFAGTDYS